MTRKRLPSSEESAFNPFQTNGIFHKSSYIVHTIKSGWSNVYIERSQVAVSKNNIVIISFKIEFVLANSADPYEMLRSVAFHLGLHCLPKYAFYGLQYHTIG